MSTAVFLSCRYSFHIDLDDYGWNYVENAAAIRDILLLKVAPRLGLVHAWHIPGYSFLIFPLLAIRESLIPVSFFSLMASLSSIWLIYLVSFALSEDRQTSVLAAGLLAFSGLHIAYSGYEFPMPVSVFFVLLEFLFLVCFLKNKQSSLLLAFIFLFFITINIKIENLAFLPLFIFVLAAEAKKDKVFSDSLRRSLKGIGLLSLTSLLICLPFLLNLSAQQAALMSSNYFGVSIPFAGIYFFRHLALFLTRTDGMALWAMAGLFFIQKFSYKENRVNLTAGWLTASLLPLSYYADSYAQWHALQIQVPVFILLAYVIVQALGLFVKTRWLRMVMMFSLLLSLYAKNYTFFEGLKQFSWKDIQQGVPALEAGDCVISPVPTTKFSLPFLFPENRWIFFKRGFECELDSCSGNIYYFNPISFGLTEEIPSSSLLRAEKSLSKMFTKEKVGELDFYRLQRKP